ncbi:MAG: hypothetical protein ACO1QB_17145 [Verrucomicrobiales bacterium]
MSLAGNGKAIMAATRDLSNRWNTVKDEWRDVKAAEFEKQYLMELFASAESAAAMLDELDKIIEGARRECE